MTAVTIDCPYCHPPCLCCGDSIIGVRVYVNFGPDTVPDGPFCCSACAATWQAQAVARVNTARIPARVRILED
jgi:hypothetical protein